MQCLANNIGVYSINVRWCSRISKPKTVLLWPRVYTKRSTSDDLLYNNHIILYRAGIFFFFLRRGESRLAAVHEPIRIMYIIYSRPVTGCPYWFTPDVSFSTNIRPATSYIPSRFQSTVYITWYCMISYSIF